MKSLLCSVTSQCRSVPSVRDVAQCSLLHYSAVNQLQPLTGVAWTNQLAGSRLCNRDACMAAIGFVRGEGTVIL